jgi:hypothetical protein
MFVPQFLAEAPSQTWALTVFGVTWGMTLVLLVGFPCSFLECVLSSAAAGEVSYIRWSGNPLVVIVFSGMKWLTCFLAGPVVFTGVAWLYWLQCGDPALLDWLILVELGVVAVAYWFLALLALTDRGRLRDLNPVAVADLAHRLGWRALAAVGAAALLVLGHGALLVAAVAEVHRSPARGLLVLVAAWMSGLFWGTFFCRLLGVWCHNTRQRLAA